jgi:peptidoglycan/LPS O-acetylase OafA/YrhL
MKIPCRRLFARCIPSQPSTGAYRADIDGLRAVAVVAVIINHFNHALLPGGYLGVDMFFVISGFVITKSLEGKRKSIESFREYACAFYEKRIKRIYPALVAYTLIAGIAICLVNNMPGLSLRTGITGLFGLSNIYLLRSSTDYFAQASSLNIFTQTWSLAVEEQFYLIFPILAWVTGYGSASKMGLRNLTTAMAILSALSLASFLLTYGKS